MTLPCGQCIGCRMDRARDWSTRIHHEASLYEANCFVTLTFSDENLPEDYSISVRDIQLFMKRLRKKLGHPVRYFACGEYGDYGGRPHYHLILFGYDPPDRTLWRRTQTDHLVYRSATLEQVWPYGHVEIGTVTLQSANYVARYITKKVTGEQAEEHYRRIHPLTGVECQVKPEFICMSSKPGIGRDWYSQFSDDVFPSDFVVIEGRKTPIPRYYKKQLSERDTLKLNYDRKQKALPHAENNTPDRLAVREESQTLRAERLKRDLESEQ